MACGDLDCQECPECIEMRGRALPVQAPGSVPRFLVVICREGVTEATPFANRDAAELFYDHRGIQWSDAYLCKVEKGPKV